MIISSIYNMQNFSDAYSLLKLIKWTWQVSGITCNKISIAFIILMDPLSSTKFKTNGKNCACFLKFTIVNDMQWLRRPKNCFLSMIISSSQTFQPWPCTISIRAHQPCWISWLIYGFSHSARSGGSQQSAVCCSTVSVLLAFIISLL